MTQYFTSNALCHAVLKNMRKKRLLLLPLLAMSVAGLTGCGVMNSVTAPLEQFTGNTQNEPVTADDVDVGMEEENTHESDIFGDVIENETLSENGTQESSYKYFEGTSENSNGYEDYYTTTSSVNNGTTTESDDVPLYSAEYYFKQISDMELPEGATADKDGNIHYKGYRLLKCSRDMLPSAAVVGAEINYEIYVTALPEDEKSANKRTVSNNEDDVIGIIEDNTSRGRVEPVEESINRVRNAVEEASKNKNNVEEDSYESINREATANMGKNVDTNTKETASFTPTTPDEDPEYEGRLVSVGRTDIAGA